ncbi:cytochrome c biogenesis protein CcdA [Methanolobus sp. WCC1]|uniref:urease accessory protein UreH domain-containing protein n=1 Tax=unclassified Methanolobus TaxID=2629569 RepID=UPI0032537D0D
MKSYILYLIFLSISLSSAQPIYVEYFYQDGCHDCEVTAPLINQIEKQYEDINIVKINVGTKEGFNKWNQYNFLEVPAIVINNETKISKEQITEDNLKLSIDNYLKGEKEDIKYNSTLDLPFAYSLGLFAGLSPCLMAILGFLLSFTAGTSESVRNGMTRATIFGIGLITSYLLIGIGLIMFKKSIPNIEVFSSITGIIVIAIGLYLVGLLKAPLFLENYFQDAARKHASTAGGLFLLGVLFSLVKVPCTLPMLLVLLNKTVSQGTIGDLSLLLVFSLGVLTPFVGVGLIGGYTLSKRIRNYRDHMKLVSGFVLILLGLWIVF